MGTRLELTEGAMLADERCAGDDHRSLGWPHAAYRDADTVESLAIARRCLGNLAVPQELDRHHPAVLEPACVAPLLRDQG